MDMQEKLAAFGAATNNDVFDATWGPSGTWMCKAEETLETIDDFVRLRLIMLNALLKSLAR